MIYTCAKCGSDFSTKPRKRPPKYCSPGCYLSDRWGESHCRFCGVATGDRTFCSDVCRKSYWNKNDFSIKKPRFWVRKNAIVKQLGGACVKCGNTDIRCLDINHKDRSQKVRPKDRKYNWTRRLKEWSENIENIELLCANCHRIHTWEQMGYGL